MTSQQYERMLHIPPYKDFRGSDEIEAFENAQKRAEERRKQWELEQQEQGEASTQNLRGVTWLDRTKEG